MTTAYVKQIDFDKTCVLYGCVLYGVFVETTRLAMFKSHAEASAFASGYNTRMIWIDFETPRIEEEEK